MRVRVERRRGRGASPSSAGAGIAPGATGRRRAGPESTRAGSSLAGSSLAGAVLAGPALLLAALLSACGGEPRREGPPHVLLLSVDSVRQDHLSAYGRESGGPRREPTSPTFDALAARGVLFENARSSTSWTLPSHMALMTGLPDLLHGVVDNRRRLAPGIPTAAELFADAGYATGGFFSGPNLHPTFGFGRGFEEYVDCSQVTAGAQVFEDLDDAELGAFAQVHRSSHVAVTSPGLVEAAGRYASAVLAAGERPLFCFVHWWDPHYDYLAPRAYVERFTSGDYRGSFTGNHLLEKGRPVTPRDVEHLRELYDAEIRFTDDEIARLLEVFEEHDALDRTLVVYTSDHGEDFHEHGRWGHQRNLFETSVRIPLCLAGPGVPRGRRVSGAARLYDVLPTIAELCGVDLPDHVEGRSLAALWEAPDAPGPVSTLHLDVAPREIELSAVVDGAFKAIYDHRRERLEVYDLERDPGERRPRRPEELGAEGEAAARTLGAELARLEQARATLPGADLAGLDDDLVRQLEAMGYAVPEDDTEAQADGGEGGPEAPADGPGDAAPADGDRRE